MIRAKSTKGFSYRMVHPQYMVKLGLKPASETFKVRKGQTIEIEDRYRYEELRDIVRSKGGDLVIIS